MPIHHLARQSERNSHRAHFVFEKLPQRLHQLEAHMRRQSPDIVVRLNNLRFAGTRTCGLDDVRIDCALSQKRDSVDQTRFRLKHFYKIPPDNLALLLRVSDACKRIKKARLRVHPDHTYTQVLSKGAHHLIALAQAQETVIDKYTDELLADGPVQKRCNDRRIHAA